MVFYCQQTSIMSTLKIDYYSVKKAALILRALNHKLRQQLLKLIEEEKKITVTEIYVRLRLEQSVASQHLAILRKAGIVITERQGKFIYYLINYNRIDEISRIVNELVS
jgi:ArsR family transcriptional regulator, virulence genes transcriptional regulator